MFAFLENVNLAYVHTIASVAGIFLAAYCAQLFGRGVFGDSVLDVGRSMRRFSTVCFGVACAWSVIYQENHNWQPWPPDLVIILSVNLYLISIIIAAAKVNRAFG
jgi:hypothetical protein